MAGRLSPRVLFGALVVVFIIVHQFTMLSHSVAQLRSRVDMLSASPAVGVAAPAPRTTSARVPGLPISMVLGERLHVDVGQGGHWTKMRSPDPIPPPRPLVVREKNMYGGSQEAAHVGGFLQNDTLSYEPRVWEFMTQVMGIKSVVDVGCGRGISTKWFFDHGCRVKCAEATEEGVRTTVLPSRDLIVQHDFTQGPWWPMQTFDAVWSVEFLEHVEEKYMDNWFATFRSAHYVFTSHSKWAGHHHVAIHHDWWWIEKFESRGFQYLPLVTELVRRLSMSQSHYVRQSALVFRNTRNVRLTPLGGPGSGGQSCDETRRLLKGTQLLKQACQANQWNRGHNPIIPWVVGCKKLCKEVGGEPLPGMRPAVERLRP